MAEMSASDTTLVEPRWTGVFLVCKACGKRRDGPKDLKPKTVAGIVRQESKRASERSRVVMTGCLGLCPKAAVAIAHVGSGSNTRMVAVKSRRKTREVVALLSAVVTGSTGRPDESAAP